MDKAKISSRVQEALTLIESGRLGSGPINLVI